MWGRSSLSLRLPSHHPLNSCLPPGQPPPPADRGREKGRETGRVCGRVCGGLPPGGCNESPAAAKANRYPCPRWRWPGQAGSCEQRRGGQGPFLFPQDRKVRGQQQAVWFGPWQDFPPGGMWGRLTPEATVGCGWHLLKREYKKSLLPVLGCGGGEWIRGKTIPWALACEHEAEGW